jgi:hypothetical protein
VAGGGQRPIKANNSPPANIAAIKQWGLFYFEAAALRADRSALSPDLGGPTMFARIGIMRALNRHVGRVFNPDRKDHHWGKRRLKRDE